MHRPPAARARSSGWLSPNILAALCGVAIFHAVSVASGSLDVSGGLGWDGFIYARMVEGDLADGSPNARTRPLMVLVARIPYLLGADTLDSFVLLNYVYAFELYLVVCLLLQRHGLPGRVRLIVVSNLALCVATSKMFGFYPVQIDFGALAITALAFYLVVSNQPKLGAVACLLAAASREFGLAAPLFGIHRALRLRRPLWEPLAYLPGVAVTFTLRWWSSTQVGSGDPLAVADAVRNLQFWYSPVFVAAFVYFAVVVFGGISALLLVRAPWCLQRLRREPELVTFLLVVVGATVAGNLDVWRYLAFTAPVAMVLLGQYLRELEPRDMRRVLMAMTLFTVLSQRPLEAMDTAAYFRDWFPLYHYFGVHPGAEGLANLWIVRAASVGLMAIALYLTLRQTTAAPAGADRLVPELRSA